jgi:hypothetical protein
MKKTMLMLGVVSSLLLVSCSTENFPGRRNEKLSNDVVLKWDEVAYEAFGGTTYQHSLMASRINAMVHLAMHDAVNAVQPRYGSYVFTMKDHAADANAAAAAAAHTVLLHETPERKTFIDSALQQSLSAIADGQAKTRGINLGRQAGQAIIAARANDGAAANPIVPVMPSSKPGDYEAVPPFNFCFAPFWEDVKLFSLQRKDQFRSVAPPPLHSDAYTAAFNEVKSSGKLNSTTRTADQTSYAKFWYEFSEAGWNRIVRVVAVNKKLDLHETARLFALVDIAMADAYIAGWDSKLHYNLWRPYTAIRKAATDGNDHTMADLQWEPEQPTPPIQDYPSTHSALGNAAATVLAKVLGDHTTFTMASPTAFPIGGTRTFTSFSQAAKENADSRVRAGIHFRFACEAGMVLGGNIGKWTADNLLKPLK